MWEGGRKEEKWWLQRENQLWQYMQGCQSYVKCMLIKNDKVRKNLIRHYKHSRSINERQYYLLNKIITVNVPNHGTIYIYILYI